MKSAIRSILVISSLFGATSAFASGQWHLECNNMAGDGGYAVTFSPDGLSAEVQENNIAGARVVARLTCPKVAPVPCCDRITTKVCTEGQDASANDTAYSATLQTGGFAGISRVTLHHGRATVAVINCKSEQ